MEKSVILHRCAVFVPDLVAQDGIQANSCILQARIVIESLKYFGIDAIPISCTTEVYNPVLAKRIISDNAPKTVAEMNDDEWSVGIGFGKDRPGYWGGHLIVGELNEWMMDTSLGQASRPNYDMQLSPLLAKMPPDFLGGGRFHIEHDNCLLSYTVCMNNHRYQQGGDWRSKKYWDRYVGATIRSIKRGVVTLR